MLVVQSQRGFYVKDMKEVIVTSIEQVLELFAEGERTRQSLLTSNLEI
jgi:acetolactate synthase regulatory subunit